MPIKMKEILKEFAQAIAEYAEVKYPVNNIHKTAEDMGFEIQYDFTLSEFEEVIVRKNKKGKPEIVLSGGLPTVYQTEKIAQGIIIAIMFMGYIVDDEKCNSYPEIEHQRWKSEDLRTSYDLMSMFLLPDNIFKQTAHKYLNGDEYNTALIAKELCVSTGLVHYRGVELGMFKRLF